MRRSMLFVPGNTPKMMTSCGFFGADAVIFDLEDAVSPTEKDAARDLVRLRRIYLLAWCKALNKMLVGSPSVLIPQ